MQTLESPTVILAERAQRLQDAEVLLTNIEAAAKEIKERQTLRGQLNIKMDKQIGICTGLEQARGIIREHDPKSPAIAFLSCEIVEAHKAWNQLYQAWSGTL